MTGQARSAASLSGSGDGLAMMRNPPPAIVSEPAVARPCSRLSATLASSCASRQEPSRLSACLRSRTMSESWLCSGDASSEAANNNPRTLDIDKHPPPREDGEWAGAEQQHRLRDAQQVQIDVCDTGDDLHEDERANHAEDDARRARRSRGYGKEHRIRDEHGEREPHRQPDRIRLQSWRQRRGEYREGGADENGGNWRRQEHQSRAE